MSQPSIVDPSQDSIHLSSTLATTFLGCRASAAWTLEARRGQRPFLDGGEDPHGDLIVRKGQAHEAACAAFLHAQHGPPVTIPHGHHRARSEATLAAMDRGVPLIHRGTLASDLWLGHAGFLVRVEEPCPSWAWSYEPWDAKLARHARPEHLFQLAIHGDLLAGPQGRPAQRGVLMLATGAEGPDHRAVPFALDEVRYYVRRAAGRLEAFAAELPGNLTPDPCGHCDACAWLPACEVRWDEADHLCRVADLTKRQTARLQAAGVSTLAMLAALDTSVPGISAGTLARLTQQARLQIASAASGEGMYERLTSAPGLGFDRLPQPDPGDLFFDFEGDPMHPGGLEYLCGVLWRAGQGDGEGEPVPGHPDLRFVAFWAHDRAEERIAFAALMDFLSRRLGASPLAHLYHYAPYEKTALRRLASLHGTREAAVDDLLRQGRMVDLYRVVREGLRIGERGYSIKKLERFYMPARTTQVTSGGASTVVWDLYQRSRDPRLRDEIRDYNRDDCLSTLLLRDWLEALVGLDRPRVAAPMPAPSVPESDRERSARQVREARVLSQAALVARLIDEPAHPDAGARRLAADLVGFHDREAKPSWWAFFDRQERDADEHVEDDECLGACVAAGPDWIGQERGSLTFRFDYPAQETKLRVGDTVYVAATGESAGAIVTLDEGARRVTLKRGKARGPLPDALSLMPGGPIDSAVLRDAIHDVGTDLAGEGNAFPHIRALLRRDPPRFTGRAPGAPVIALEDQADPGRLLQAAIRAVGALDRSWLVIQGPPGAGKTYTISHLIAALVAAGRMVGIASNSHKAIDNVLHAVETRLHEQGAPLQVAGQKKDGGGDRFEGRGYVESVDRNDALDPDIPVLGGTAWVFARPELRASRDVLFVDEAGQVSLANLVAMAAGAKAVVLVGDQMQLAQPIQGTHPGDSGVSALDHLLQGQAVVPAAHGIFLSRTWRMHPALCAFVSAAIYEGRLEAEAGCARQRLVLGADAHPALKPAGLAFQAVAHAGCRQRSEEEARATREILESLLGQEVVDRHGRQRAMTLDDVLVVAPYNLQVNLLRDRLPNGARVGTVDKFQGQETEVVIVSMTTSGAEEMPRDAAFLLSRNRLNVAISRARCLAVLVASPGLLDLVAGSVEEMRLANLFCWAESYSADRKIDALPPFAEDTTKSSVEAA